MIFSNTRTPGFSFVDDVNALVAKGWARFHAIEYVENGLRIKRCAAELARSEFACGFAADAKTLYDLTERAERNAALDARYQQA